MGLEVDRSRGLCPGESILYDRAVGKYSEIPITVYRWGWKWTGAVDSILQSLRYDGASGKFWVSVEQSGPAHTAFYFVLIQY